MLTVTGIIANVTNSVHNHNKYTGFLKGILYTFGSFFLANVIIYILNNKIDNKLLLFVCGILSFYFIDVLIHYITMVYIHKNEIQHL